MKYEVAVIGAGPGGISAALECIKGGISSVILLEKGAQCSNTIRKFYKDGKRVDRNYKGQSIELKGSFPFTDGDKDSTLKLFDSVIDSNNINIKYNNEVDSIKKQNDTFMIRNSDNSVIEAKFVVISIGKMGQPNKPSYEIPASIRKIINYNANECQNNEKILIVGGGNSAVEYAIDLAKSANATLNYRRSEFTRINDENAKLLQEVISSGKLKTKLGVDITSIDEEGSQAKVNFTDGSSECFSRVVYAIGGASPVDFLKKCGISVDDKGAPICEVETISNIKNMFLAGDIALKSGGSIALAIKHGYDIAQNIIKSK